MPVNPSASILQAISTLPVQGGAQPQPQPAAPQAARRAPPSQEAQPPRFVGGTPPKTLPRGSLLDIRV